MQKNTLGQTYTHSNTATHNLIPHKAIYTAITEMDWLPCEEPEWLTFAHTCLSL